jgi:F0F1-type ATP synthase membrane subunit b/b'
VKEIADAETNARPQAPQPGELPAGEGAGEARGRQGEEGQPAALPGELDAELHHAEQALASARGRGEEIHHEDLAELERANAELADANAEADAMLEAATCLGEAIA